MERRGPRLAIPDARRLLITADSGGSNSSRTRAWKTELAALALQTGLEITACHFPPGTSKWNKIEHRLFAHITMNWRGRPLTSHEVIPRLSRPPPPAPGYASAPSWTPVPTHPAPRSATSRWRRFPCAVTTGTATGTTPCTPGRRPRRISGAAARSRRAPRLGASRPHGHDSRRWDQLTAALAIPYQAQREAGLHIARGGPASRQPAGGHPAALTLAEKTLVTIMRQRLGVPQPVLAELFGVSANTIGTAERQIKPLLARAGHTIEPATTPLTTLADLTAYATSHGITLAPKPNQRVNNRQVLNV